MSTAGMQQLVGVPLSSGLAIGRAITVHGRRDRIYRFPLEPDQIEPELDRLERAVELTRRRIEGVAAGIEGDLSTELAAIFDAHQLMLEDRQFLGRVEERIRRRQVNAEWAVARVSEEFEEKFRSDPLLVERIGDLKDVCRGLIASLQGLDFHQVSDLGDDVVIVASDLTPSEAIRLGRQGVVAFALERGGATSHTTIIARALDLPMVGGLEDVTELATDDDAIVVDGDRGSVTLHPDADTIARMRQECALRQGEDDSRQVARELPGVTRDGTKIELLANIDLEEELTKAVHLGADGIGLYRSEFLYIERSPDLPDEMEQYAFYLRLAESFPAGTVTIRTYDLGGRKLAHELIDSVGDNPALGLRGIRLTLTHHEIFKPQIRALLRAGAERPLRLLLPMVSSLDEVRQFRALMGATVEELLSEGVAGARELPVGIMIEVPAAVCLVDRLVQEVAFLAIGTNDLTQYTLAVDRNDDRVAELYSAVHPAVLQMVARVVAVGRDSDTEITLCGELAADTRATPLLLGLGLRSLSLGPQLLPEVKLGIRELELAACEELAIRALAASRVRDVEELLERFAARATARPA